MKGQFLSKRLRLRRSRHLPVVNPVRKIDDAILLLSEDNRITEIAIDGKENGLPLKGYVLGNFSITVMDAFTALKIATGSLSSNTEQKWIADVDDCGSVTSMDSLIILRYAMGIIDEFPM